MCTDRRWFLVLVLVVCFSGCLPAILTDAQMNSYIGKPADAIALEFGPPHQVVENPNGKRVWAYYIGRELPGYAMTYTYGNWRNYATTTVEVPSTGYTAIRIFYIDENGKVFGVHWKGI